MKQSCRSIDHAIGRSRAKPCRRAALALALGCMLFGCSLAGTVSTVAENRTDALTPLDTTYRIDGEEFVLTAGRASIDSFRGGASKTVVQVFGEPVSGDLDGDGETDAAVMLVQTTGGSGTFYYVAAALKRGGTFVGTSAVFIGDRIVPQQLAIRHSVVLVDYADRQPGETMAAPPLLGRSKYLVSKEDALEEIGIADGEVLVAGEVVIGHEVRSFSPCGACESFWLVGGSPALAMVQVAYHLTMSDAPPYTPLFMVLVGKPTESPADGFGADYPAGFRATRLVLSRPGESCSATGQQQSIDRCAQ